MNIHELEGIEELATKKDLADLENRLTHAMQVLSLELSDKFHKELIGVVQWFVVVMAGFATIILGGVYFMLAHFKP